MFSVLWVALLCLSMAGASVTVYHKPSLGPNPTETKQPAAAASYTGAAAYNPTVLQAPPIPNPAPPNQFNLNPPSSGSGVQNLSIPQSGTFYGFSIEMSVVNQVLGLNSSFLQVPFLNLMSHIKSRAGEVYIRVGGNTQDYAVLKDSLPGGKAILKDKAASTNPTDTPTLLFTPEIINMLSSISKLVNAKWYLGVPFNDTSNLRLEIAEVGEAILGDNLLGLQVGNEPDLYANHGHRPQNYTPTDYHNEFGTMVQAIQSNSKIPVNNRLIAPSVATGPWSPEDVWNTGFIPSYSNNLGFLAVEHYPNDNCYAQFGIGQPRDAQTEFPNYLNHSSGQSVMAPYLNSAQIAQQAGKPLLMFETNTASCGGFPGISDSFGATLWALDYGLQMAYSNFSGALLHVGGQSVYYNPFTPPPTNQSAYHQWSIGAIFYSVLAVAETFGSSGKAQIVDLFANGGNIFTPAYAIYENGQLVRVALFNYVTDPSGNSTYTVTISVGGGQTNTPNGTPGSVRVKRLSAPSVSEKTNITWAGQTFGGNFESDGRLQGSVDIETVNCDTNANTCQVKVPAPGFALVFLGGSETGDEPSPQTFATTSVTKTIATVDPSVLSTSNGHGGSSPAYGSTSKGGNGAGSLLMPSLVALFTVVFLVGRIISQ